MVKFWVFRHKGARSVTWCARQMRSRSWRLRNLLTTSAPKVKETPRSFSPQPWTSLSGSDHSRSHSKPDKNKKKGRSTKSQRVELNWRQCSGHMCFPFVWTPCEALRRQTKKYSNLVIVSWSTLCLLLAQGQNQILQHNRPVSGTSVGLMMRRICSMDCRSGESPWGEQMIVKLP